MCPCIGSLEEYTRLCRYPWSYVALDDKFVEDDVLFLPCDEFVIPDNVIQDINFLDFYNFKGRSLSSDVTPRQMVMVEKGVNEVEFDVKTFKLLEKIKYGEQKVVKIEFELNSLENRRGAVLSLLANYSQLLRVKVVFPKTKEGFVSQKSCLTK